MALQNPEMGGGLAVPNAGMFGAPATLSRNPDPSGAGITSPTLFPVEPAPITNSGEGDHWTPNQSGGVTINDFGWTNQGLPGGPVTGFGYNDPRGINPPTEVPDFWGPSGQHNGPYGGAGGPLGFAGGSHLPALVHAKAGHNANYWVF